MQARKRAVLAVLIMTLAGGGLMGCQSDALLGGLLGSAIGAGAGAGIDHDNRGRGALIGAGIGAISGYIVGNEMDKSKARQARYDY